MPLSTTPAVLLRVDASPRGGDSQSRRLADALVAKLSHGADVRVASRDVSGGIEFVDQAWINANFTPEAERTVEQVQRLSGSDAMVQEVMDADTLVISTPIYNFGVPAALKSWIDQVVRARKTFRYTENGPVGLLEGKRAFVVITSGGTESGSEIDFATNYLRHILGFIGIKDVTVIAADRLSVDAEKSIASANAAIAAAA